MSCSNCGQPIPDADEKRSTLLIESMQEILTIFAKAAKGELCLQCVADDVRQVALDLSRVECFACHGHSCSACGHTGYVNRV